MKKSTTITTILIFLLFNSFHGISQFITWHWSITEGDALNEYITAIDNDPEGNIYVTGNFQGTSDFFGETLSSKGSNDVFIARFDPNGNMIWVKHGGGEYEDSGRDIYVDDEFVYVTGGFVDQVIFDNETMVSDGARDVFLLKYDLDGSLIWANRGGSVTDDAGNSVSADESGNIYITGDINYAATFGDHTIPYYGFTDVFIAKYDSNGNCEWAKSAGGSVYDYGACIETVDGHLFVSGAFNDVAQFDTAMITSVDIVDVFIAHYLTDGSFVEVMSAGGTNNENIACMAVDPDLNVYIGGWYMLDITFGDHSFTTYGGSDIFVAKFAPGNGFVWADSYGGTGNDEAQGMSLGWITGGKSKADNPLILTGTFENTISFGNTDMTSDGFDDGFILQLNEDGAPAWTHQIGGSGTLRINDCVIDPDARCYFAGDFVDELKIGNKTYNSAGGYDLFIAKLGESLGIEEAIEDVQISQLTIFPNPFTTSTKLSYFLETDSKVLIEIYGQEGRFIEQIINENQPKGDYKLVFNEVKLPKGTYQVVMKTNQQTLTRKIIKLSD